MNHYVIQFFYGTDLRTDCKVSAVNEVYALTIAMNEMHTHFKRWINPFDANLHIVIKAAPAPTAT